MLSSSFHVKSHITKRKQKLVLFFFSDSFMKWSIDLWTRSKMSILGNAYTVLRIIN